MDFGSPNAAGLNTPKSNLLRYETCQEIDLKSLICKKEEKVVTYTLDSDDKVIKLELELNKKLLLSYGIKEKDIVADMLEAYTNTYSMIHGHPTMYSKINKIALYRNLAENFAIIYYSNNKLFFKAYRSKKTFLTENKDLINNTLSGSPICGYPLSPDNKDRICGQYYLDSFK